MTIANLEDASMPPPFPDLASIRKILVIKLRAIGDVVLSTVVTQNLRVAFPAAVIHYLTEQPSHDVIRLNPFLDGGLVYNRNTMSGLDLIRLVRKGSYDLVIDLFGNPRTALVTRLSRARVRAGFRFRGRAYAYNVVVEPRGDRVHNTQFNLDALEALGIPIVDRSLHLSIAPEDDTRMGAYLERTMAPERKIVCLNPGGGWYTKRWGIERFAELGDRLVEEVGAAILLAWGPGEEKDVHDLARRMKHAPCIPPATSLTELAALLKRCALMITNDSGPMHVAAAVGTPVVGIYGPTNPLLQGPYGPQNVVVRREGLACLGCNRTTCDIGLRCMVELEVGPILEQAKRILYR
jgi:lipopolysaccharide heptosyltransferase II